MKRFNLLSIIIFYLFFGSFAFGKNTDLKNQAIEEFKKANYSKAINLLNQALEIDKDDPEIYYYLGYFTHYLCYDSVPLPGFNLRKSDEILNYLTNAIKLKPNYGDAFYFIGAEHGTRANRFLKNGETDKAIEEYKLAKQKGGLPDWLLEYGRNNLKTCERNALLFTGGDADVNPIRYLQLVEKFRLDVTVIPIGLLNRPWFVLLLKDGLKDVFNSAPISWSKEQILNMHPYKWENNIIELLVTKEIKDRYKTQKNFEWELKPDLQRKNTNFLSPIGAIIADIVKTNQWKRPIYFSSACQPWMFYGLDQYFQTCGTISRLLPFKTENSDFQVDNSSIVRIFMNQDNYKFLPTVVKKDMPRVSTMLRNYRVVLFRLSYHYYQNHNNRKAKEVLDFMDRTILEKYVPLGSLGKSITSFRNLLH
jgi:hypothetical protein